MKDSFRALNVPKGAFMARSAGEDVQRDALAYLGVAGGVGVVAVVLEVGDHDGGVGGVTENGVEIKDGVEGVAGSDPLVDGQAGGFLVAAGGVAHGEHGGADDRDVLGVDSAGDGAHGVDDLARGGGWGV